jgi:hypothetical protein
MPSEFASFRLLSSCKGESNPAGPFPKLKHYLSIKTIK